MKGLVPENVIENLKKEYPELQLFKWVSQNKKDEAVFRPISIELMNSIKELSDEATMQDKPLPLEQINEKIFDSCVLWPKLTIEEKMLLRVGDIPQISKSIQEKSGFINIDVLGRVLGPDDSTITLKDFDYWGDIPAEEKENLSKSAFALFRLRVGRWVFAIRPMTRTDLKLAEQSNDPQMAIARSVIMWPNPVNWDSIPAGLVDTISKRAMDISGWDDTSEVEEL